MAHTATTVSIKKGDEVIVMTGKDRGRSGRVVNVLPSENKVMVEGIARAKKATRPSKKRQQGGIIDIEQFIHLSNVQWCASRAASRPGSATGSRATTRSASAPSARPTCERADRHRTGAAPEGAIRPGDRPAMQAERGYASIMQVPRVEKIVVNMGVGDALRDAKVLDAAVEDLQTITGQKPW